LLSIAVWNGILLFLGVYLGNEAEGLLNRFFTVSTGIFLLTLFGWFLKHKFRV